MDQPELLDSIEWFEVIAHHKNKSRPIRAESLYKSVEHFLRVHYADESDYWFIELIPVTKHDYIRGEV